MRFLLLIFALASGLALAQETPMAGNRDDEAALALADTTKTEASARRACLEYAEAAAFNNTYSDGAPSSPGGRASASVRCDVALAGSWRGVVSDRFDEIAARGSAGQAINTLKEAYVSFRAGGAVMVDVGRVNVRQGVAFAYNPTDYFKVDAVRTIISIDPDVLRDERMGTVMGRAQALWSSGSLTGIFAPRLGARPNDSTFNPDLGATNAANRWLLIASQRLGRDFQPQILLTGTEHQSPQVGLNMTYLLGRATVAYVEWSGGRSASNLFRAGYPTSGDTAFQSRLSTGLTYTTSYKLSVTLEYQRDEAAPASSQWAAIRSGPIPPYVQYREYAGAQGELAARQNLFAYAHWDDVGVDHLELTAFVRFDPYDHSRVTWTEARYHWQHAGIAVQWQRSAGDQTSDVAPRPGRQSWLALVDYYF